ALENVLGRSPRHQLHADRRITIGPLRAEDEHAPRVIEGGRQPAFPLETLEGFAGGVLRLQQQLERAAPPRLQALRLPDLAESALTQESDQVVGPQLLVGPKRRAPGPGAVGARERG